MGSNESVSIERVTDEQLQQIKNGTISAFSYQIFLNNFYFVIRYENFYTKLPLEKQVQIIDNIGVLTKDECSTIIKNYCKFTDDEKNLFSSLLTISKRMICKTRDENSNADVYLPVGLDKKLWKKIMIKRFQTGFGEYKITKGMVDFKSQEMISQREQFISQKQGEITQFEHSKDLSLLIQNNPVDNLWKKDINLESNYSPKKISKPLFWETNVHQAAFKGKKSSIEYSLSLFPQMLFLLDDTDNTLVHHAASGNQNNMLIYLHEIGADFNLANSEGFFPIHLITNKSAIETMNSLGININVRNEKGESLLDIRTRVAFDKSIIKALLNLGFNIFDPNPKGDFWIQTTMHHKYYGNMKEDKFVNFVRKQLLDNKSAAWNENPIYQEIINRKAKDQVNEDIKDLNESVIAQNIPRINVLLAMGTKADEVDSNGETNLFYCAKNGLMEILKILLNNYCNPNFANSQKENTFWVAAINEHFDAARLLRKRGADANMLNSSGETLLHNVYRRKMTQIFQFVLNAGGNPNVKNRYGETVTFIAFKNRDDNVAEMLQNRYNGNINSQDDNQNSLVHLALDNDDFDRIDYLCRRRINMNLKDENSHTVLMKAFLKDVNLRKLEFLVNHGSDIDTVDKNNNSLLHHLFFKKNPSDAVFTFLIENDINYNIKNDDKQFPISIAIKNCHDNIGFKLLRLNCKLLDKDSIHEPIVEALKRGSSNWFDELVNHGADAMNQKFGVISRYINSGFFNYRIFQQIPRMDIFIEAPLQMALYKKYERCALDIWNYADTKSLKVKLASNHDKHDRIPLSAAIMVENENFVNILINSSYDCTTYDENRRTPFIYACIANRISWMVDIFKIISISAANTVDRYDCSALTYAASNNRQDFCDALFINNIEVFKIKVDKYGIIEHYRDLISRYNAAKDKLERICDEVSRILDILESDHSKIKKRLNNIDFDIRMARDEMNSLGNKTDYTTYDETRYKNAVRRYRSLENDKETLQEYLPRVQTQLRKTQSANDCYQRNYESLKNATRKDMLEDISRLESLSQRSYEIGNLNYRNDVDDSVCTIF